MTESTNAVTRTFETGDVSETVVMAVAEAKDVDPLDLDALYTTIDPDALNDVFQPTIGDAAASMELSFSMAGCDVEVHGTGDVVVTPSSEPAEKSAVVAAHGD